MYNFLHPDPNLSQQSLSLVPFKCYFTCLIIPMTNTKLYTCLYLLHNNICVYFFYLWNFINHTLQFKKKGQFGQLFLESQLLHVSPVH